MKTAKDWTLIMYKSDNAVSEIIKQIQTESWNEAIKTAAEAGYNKMYDIGEHEDEVKESILKLLK